MEVRGRKGVARLLAAYAAIAFILPYLALKIAWVSGVPVGMANEIWLPTQACSGSTSLPSAWLWLPYCSP